MKGAAYMETGRQLLVGVDLGRDFAQISYYDKKIYEPVPVGIPEGEDRIYEIPFALLVNPNTNEWLWKTKKNIELGGYTLIDNILDKISGEEKFQAGSYIFRTKDVVKKFMIKLLSLLKEYFPNETILKLVITVPKREAAVVDMLKSVGVSLGIENDRMVVFGRKQSYMYYAVSQSKELWANNVGLFEYDEDGLRYTNLTVDKRTLPYIVGTDTQDLSHIMPYEALEENQDIEYMFLNTANTILHKKMVTTIYVTGKGFEKAWATEALRKLCNGRRVFRGQNLFTKGACYAARALTEEEKLKEFIFLDDDMLTSDISITTYHDAKIHDVVLARAGTLWNDIDASIDIIPDNEDEIQITDRNILSRETRAHILSLSGFAARENKMTRFTVRIRFADRNTCIVTLKDNGFGEFSPSTNRIWERYIKLDAQDNAKQG